MNENYLEQLIGGSIADFINPFVGASDPVDDAICSVLYKMQSEGADLPQDFVSDFRRFIVANLAADFWR